jgi:non-heme chloroperoxidase
MSASSKSSIVFVHGLWMTPSNWADWVAHYEAKGYKCSAPGWPGVDTRTIAEINADPAPLQGITIKNVVYRYEEVIQGLDTPPIIIGHSFGGLLVQLLLNRGLGCAGVGLSAG